jgi:hypothetical protein
MGTATTNYLPMPIENPKYDVAISFLTQDEAIAAAIAQKLSEGLEVFFYPRKQEELAGTDGMESMRTPFLNESRVMVVLHRERWGKTPWTRVEETAIKDACFEHGWERLFFIVLDQASVLPLWLPKTHIRFNYMDFGLEQAVGAIKARVQERGGQHLPLTPLRRAEIFKAAEQFRLDKSRMNTSEGIEAILNSVSELFGEIEKQCARINAQGHMQIKCGIEFQQRNAIQSCGITDNHVGLYVAWLQQWTNSLDSSRLVVRELSGGIIVPGETGRIYLQQPRLIRETNYSPDLSLAREYGWKGKNGSEFLSSRRLAERSVIQFMDLADRHARGEE